VFRRGKLIITSPTGIVASTGSVTPIGIVASRGDVAPRGIGLAPRLPAAASRRQSSDARASSTFSVCEQSKK